MNFKKNFNKTLNKVFVGLSLSLLLCLSVFAQSGTSSINGLVTDQQWTTVSGATIKTKQSG